MITYYDIERYATFVLDRYGVEIEINICRELPTLTILEDSQEELLKYLKKLGCCCECHQNIDMIEEAIYIMTYRIEYIGGANDDDNGYYNARITAFNYMMNRGLIYYG